MSVIPAMQESGVAGATMSSSPVPDGVPEMHRGERTAAHTRRASERSPEQSMSDRNVSSSASGSFDGRRTRSAADSLLDAATSQIDLDLVQTRTSHGASVVAHGR